MLHHDLAPRPDETLGLEPLSWSFPRCRQRPTLSCPLAAGPHCSPCIRRRCRLSLGHAIVIVNGDLLELEVFQFSSALAAASNCTEVQAGLLTHKAPSFTHEPSAQAAKSIRSTKPPIAGPANQASIDQV